MKTKLHCFYFLFTTLALLATLNSQISTAFAQGTMFTYQGRLNTGTNPTTGTYDLTFSLYSASSGGGSLAGPVTNTAVAVTNGQFTVGVDFDGAFTGGSNWLSIGVRTNGVGAFSPLTPRQQVTPTPYAIFAETANAAGLSGPIPNGDLGGTYGSAVTLNNAGNSFTGSGSGLTSLNASQLTSGTVADARLAADVALTDANQTFTGSNTFSGLNASLTVSGTGPISTSLFTGLGFQFYNSSGEGAIMSSVNDGNASLTFYTKQGTGVPPAKQMAIDRYGGVAIDQQDNNNGVLEHNDTNGVGLTFGTGSGEGIASDRVSGINQNGLDFYTDFDHRMSILHNGNVGIGTTNPGTALQVNGAVTASTLDLPLPASVSAGGSSLLYADNNNNFFAGLTAGNLATSGAYNTANGDNALAAVTTGGANTADGALTLWKDTTGNNNAALGADVLAYNISGNYNTAMGVGGLEQNQSGSNNVAIGALALGNSTTDNGLVAVGYEALQNDASGPAFLTIGGANTAIGYESLVADTSGAVNTGLGYLSLYGDVGGANNTALGALSLVSIVGGSGNIGIGSLAGFDLPSGGNNNIDIGNGGGGSDSGIIRIGTPGTQTATYVVTPLALDGADTHNGLTYLTSGETAVPGGGAGPFLFGFQGGSLGVTDPTSISLSWDFQGNVWVSNNLSTASLTIRGGADLAEPFNITAGKREVPQGAVVVIDEQNPGHLKLSDRAYDTRVAGVVSGANGVNPGIQMHQQGLLEGGQNVALTGRVYVQADASNGAIRPGDLLTTSSTPGRAMKVTDHAKAAGAILGKAMTALKEGQGMVLVLVTLQ